jgi:hypothetical protein
MKPVTVAALFNPAPFFRGMMESMQGMGAVESVVVAAPDPAAVGLHGYRVVAGESFHASRVLETVLAETRTEYLLILPMHVHITLNNDAVEALVTAGRAVNVGLVYADFDEVRTGGRMLHRLNDYLPGSVRDNFDFGPMMLISVDAARTALARHGSLAPARFAALYDLRLKLSIDRLVHHVTRPLCAVVMDDTDSEAATLFDYVDPRNADAQRELEAVFTDYLKKTGAYLPPGQYRDVPENRVEFPVEASVVIPVRNRKGTIADAVRSALSQETDFPFNVIVVDNHSSDGTSEVLTRLAAEHSRLCHLVPSRTDLGIGGCWNEALHAPLCGRWAVQLDSDDLYGSTRTLRQIVDMLRAGRCGMVIGAYTLVDFDLNEIAPGLIDHREWTDDNGRNNALRINGLGAPRAFDTALMRAVGFLNVSYGEDYAAALRVCREYRVGRIYESLYLCRRWPGNTDAALTIEAANRNDAFKDAVRTDEIAARQAMNRGT